MNGAEIQKYIGDCANELTRIHSTIDLTEVGERQFFDIAYKAISEAFIKGQEFGEQVQNTSNEINNSQIQ